MPFSLAGPDNVVSLGLIDATRSDVVLYVGHFSSFGLALAQKGFSASLEGARHRLGGDLEAQLESAMGERLSKDRQSQLLGGEAGEFASVFEDFARRYLEQVVKPRLAAADTSCANSRLAIQTLLSMERTLQLLGSSVEALGFTFDFADLYKHAVVCMKEEYELCRDNHIITRMIPSFLSVLRQAELLGISGDTSVNLAKAECEHFVSKCLRFDLEMSSRVAYSESTGPDLHTFSESMHLPSAIAAYVTNTDENPSGLPRIDSTGGLIAGTFSDFTVSGYNVYYANSCITVNSKTQLPGQLAMTSVAFSRKDGDPAARAQVKDFYLVLAVMPNNSSHDISIRSRATTGCSGTPQVETKLENWSLQGFAQWIVSLSAASADSYVTGWTIVGGDILATKDVVATDGATTFTATLVLRHAPDPE